MPENSIICRVRRLVSTAGYYSFAWFLPGVGVPGLGANYALRRFLARGFVEECGAGVQLKAKVYMGQGTGIRLGDRCSIGKNCALSPNVWIGRNTLIGPDVAILSMNHEFSDRSLPIRDQGNRPSTGPVVIGDDVWIGGRATILPGVHVGGGSVVGACAVVTRDVPPWAIVAGNPARVIGWRGEDSAAPGRSDADASRGDE